MKWIATREAGLEQLHSYAEHMGRYYAERRNHDEGPPRRNVSQLSPWLHAGLISEGEVLQTALSRHSPSSADKFISEVFWRIYFKGYLEQRPTIWATYCDDRDDAFRAMRENSGKTKAYERAISGGTGIEAFDYWAKELVETGYLHNHARMWFASIWIFTLKLDWTLGADFFLRHLMDGDAASNTLSWRWVGGLHTKGKTYLARASNIARYTADHEEGPLRAEGLSAEAEPLTEQREHSRRAIVLPDGTDARKAGQPYALLLHDEAAHHTPLGLEEPPALVISAARPDARSPERVGELARRFSKQAVHSGGDAASAEFGCPHVDWTPESSLGAILAKAGLSRVITSYLPVGWTRDALAPDLQPLRDEDRLIELVSDLDRATWPHAKAGFFGVKKIMGDAMREVGIGPA